MHKSNDFILMDVVNVKGKKIGSIKDILIDFNNGYIKGFIISQNKLFKKDVSVFCDNIISFNEVMVIKNIEKGNTLKLSNFKGMDVVDTKGNLLGMVEEIIFDHYTFKIKGVILSSGFMKNFIYGKKIYLINNLILGDENILFFNKKQKMSFTTIPHEVLEVDKDEK